MKKREAPRRSIASSVSATKPIDSTTRRSRASTPRSRLRASFRIRRPPYDEFQITPLNERWELLSLKPDEGRGWLRRLRAHAWAMVAPLFERQQAFNSALVDHINRNIAMQRETTRAIEATLTVLREDQKRFIEYQTLLILYAQQITPYVDTKDRHVAGLMHGLAAGLSGLGDEIQKRWESMVARERRYDAQMNDVRTTLSVMQRAMQTLKRELERRVRWVQQVRWACRAEAATCPPKREARRWKPRRRVRWRSRWTLTSTSASKISFGDRSTTSERVAAYVPLFEGASDVLDVGCGRGEFLDLLRAKGISARGIDLNEEMAAVCRDARARRHGGRCAQLPACAARRIARRAFCGAGRRAPRAGLPDAVPRGRVSQASSRLENRPRDDQSRVLVCVLLELHPRRHARPAAPSGHASVFCERQRISEGDSALQRALSGGDETAGVAAIARSAGTTLEVAFNENVKKLNDLLFTYLDYAAIGERL